MDIEKDIEILKKFNNLNILYGRLALTEEEYNQIKQAIENILAEREEDKKKIKELEAKLEEANKQLDLDYVDENYIPKQKIKDKIEELRNEKEQLRIEKGVLWDSGIYKIDLKIEILEELLQESEDK